MFFNYISKNLKYSFENFMEYFEKKEASDILWILINLLIKIGSLSKILTFKKEKYK